VFVPAHAKAAGGDGRLLGRTVAAANQTTGFVLTAGHGGSATKAEAARGYAPGRGFWDAREYGLTRFFLAAHFNKRMHRAKYGREM
jgi:hypothetical protein